MKMIGRILIITAVFSLFAGLMITLLNVSGANNPDFNAAPRFQANDNGFRPEGGENQFGRGEQELEGGWLFGLIKNLAVLALLVTAVVWPKSIVRKRKRMAVAN
jgi:hypothetical protein